MRPPTGSTAPPLAQAGVWYTETIGVIPSFARLWKIRS